MESILEVFQREITSIISDITGRESGLKLNKTKCQIKKQSIVFLGHIISSEGIKIDSSKTEAIT